MTTPRYSDTFNYIYSCDLDINIQLKIGTLEGTRERPSYKELLENPLLRHSGLCQDGCSDLYVTCQIFADNRPIALPTQTSYKAFTTRWNWNEWITLPLKYSDLPRNAQLALTIWDIYGPCREFPVGGTTLSLFGKHGTFRRGMYDLKVWPKVEADGLEPSTTPGREEGGNDQMTRLAKLSKKHRKGRMVEVDWLDRLTFREIEMINEREKRTSNFMYLMIEFPLIHADGVEYTMVYFEKGGNEVYHVLACPEVVKFPDPDMQMENLVESKHHKLARSLRSGYSDKDLKPNASVRDQLNAIVSSPPTKILTSEEQDLVWKFRFYLTTQKKALAKFLKCVNWNVSAEAKQALELLDKWQAMDVEDALELLSPQFTNPSVRKYAVSRLDELPDEDLQLYLLQLVQALKYENFDQIHAGLDQPIIFERQREDTLTQSNVMVTSSPYKERSGSTSEHTVTTSEIHDPLSETVTGTVEDSAVFEEEPLPVDVPDSYDLATFLISRACANPSLANYLYWYLLVECEDTEDEAVDKRVKDMYMTVMKRFSQTLAKGGGEGRLLRAVLAKQQTFVDRLVALMKIIAREGKDRPRKIEKLQAMLADPESHKVNFTSFDPLPLPLDPSVKVCGLIPEQCSLFKSALMPCRLTFQTSDDSSYVAILKHGDDLRQDQLILQIITLMDMLLKKENLDLKLTPYRVLATSSRHGLVQFINSVPVREVLNVEGVIQNFFRRHAPADSKPFGISPEVMDNYVKSCAGYCVITYLLGVGDRHLDNLLLTTTGKLFHIDFGYILGRDPKPMPPPMKLTKEMVEAMGGTNSECFSDFRTLCITSFLHLRSQSNNKLDFADG